MTPYLRETFDRAMKAEGVKRKRRQRVLDAVEAKMDKDSRCSVCDAQYESDGECRHDGTKHDEYLARLHQRKV